MISEDSPEGACKGVIEVFNLQNAIDYAIDARELTEEEHAGLMDAMRDEEVDMVFKEVGNGDREVH